MKRHIILLVALFALLLSTSLNANAQNTFSRAAIKRHADIVSSSSLSSAQTGLTVDEIKRTNLLVFFYFTHRFSQRSYKYNGFWYDEWRHADFWDIGKGIPLYYLSASPKSNINVQAYEKIKRFGEVYRGNPTWSQNCSYEYGLLKNFSCGGNVIIIKYNSSKQISDIEVYNSDGSECVISLNFYYGTLKGRRTITVNHETTIKEIGVGEYEEIRNVGSDGYGDYEQKNYWRVENGSIVQKSIGQYKKKNVWGVLANKKYLQDEWSEVISRECDNEFRSIYGENELYECTQND